MELRHLRYFVAVAESRSLKLAAEQKLHTTQPSLSRQIRDLEREIGGALFVRGARGVELTSAGRVLLDHARALLAQTDAAIRSTREIANPSSRSFTMGFMIGHDSSWLPETLSILRDELPDIHVVISTQNSPQLAAAVSEGGLDVAFLRRGDGLPGLIFRQLIEEPLEVFLPTGHSLAAQETIGIQQFIGETFLSVSGAALGGVQKPPALRQAIDRYLKQSGVDIRPSHEVDNLGGIMSLIVSTQGIALLPSYAKTFLPKSVTTRPLAGVTPTIDVSMGYLGTNGSPILKRILAKADELVARIRKPPGFSSA